jgi:ferritin-like metal-binding protein YciE
MKASNNIDSLFTHQLRDLYSAEKQLTKILPRMAKKASNEDLREAFHSHAEESQHQIERLEHLFEEMKIRSRGAKCPGMEGIVEEAKDIFEEGFEADVLDAALICAAQRAEHYEIAAYGCARSLAQQVGRNDLAEELQKTLDEEHKANQKLNDIALSHVNKEAVAQSHNGHGDGHQRQEEQQVASESAVE